MVRLFSRQYGDCALCLRLLLGLSLARIVLSTHSSRITTLYLRCRFKWLFRINTISAITTVSVCVPAPSLRRNRAGSTTGYLII